jgi:hypothetical protein
MSGPDIPPAVFYALGYVFVLIGALVLVSVALNRLTRAERKAERERRAARRKDT